MGLEGFTRLRILIGVQTGGGGCGAIIMYMYTNSWLRHVFGCVPFCLHRRAGGC